MCLCLCMCARKYRRQIEKWKCAIHYTKSLSFTFHRHILLCHRCRSVYCAFMVWSRCLYSCVHVCAKVLWLSSFLMHFAFGTISYCATPRTTVSPFRWAAILLNHRCELLLMCSVSACVMWYFAQLSNGLLLIIFLQTDRDLAIEMREINSCNAHFTCPNSTIYRNEGVQFVNLSISDGMMQILLCHWCSFIWAFFGESVKYWETQFSNVRTISIKQSGRW